MRRFGEFSPVDRMPSKMRDRSWKEILEEMQSLRADLRKAEEREGERQNAELKGMLRRRGLEVFRANPDHHLLFPPLFPNDGKSRFYELFKKYSFRLF